VAWVYCNSSTQKAFEYIWEGFFKAIETATGRKIKFKVFEESGNILSIILDMEASQVKGLGTTIIRLNMNDPSISKISEVDPDIIVQFLIKLCYVHWERYRPHSPISLKNYTQPIIIALVKRDRKACEDCWLRRCGIP